jgi:hypothetical protein
VAALATASNPPTNKVTVSWHLRPELEALVRALAALSERERSEVYASVNEETRRSRGPTLGWDEWEAARGVVSLGGNAVDDSDRHYDDA